MQKQNPHSSSPVSSEGHSTSPTSPTAFLRREEGRVAYDDSGGEGPLLVLVPGIGDLRSEYRHVRADFVGMGFRVICMDLRGMGESDATFSNYNGEVVAQDILALIEHLNAGPAIVVGTSMAAGSAVTAAATSPERISRIVLVGPFTRGPVLNGAMKVMVKLLMAGPWRNPFWLSYHAKLFPGGQPADHEQHRAQIRSNLSVPARSKAFASMMKSDHKHSESRYADVRSPVLVVMGSKDADFPDPEKEAREVAQALRGEYKMIEGAGHYPQAEVPQAFVSIVKPFVLAGTTLQS